MSIDIQNRSTAHGNKSPKRVSVSTPKTWANMALTAIRERIRPRTSVMGIQTTQTDETIISYLELCKKLTKQASRERNLERKIGWREFIDWYLSCDGRWSKKTVNLYRMSIVTAIEAFVTDEEFAAELIGLVESGPEPKSTAQTKTEMEQFGKRRQLPISDWKAFRDECYRRDKKQDLFCLAFLHLCLTYGPRPVEWATAVMIGERLLIQTAKSTNHRSADCELSEEALAFLNSRVPSDRMVVLAGDYYREIDLLWENENSDILMTKFLGALRSQVQQGGGWKLFYKSMCQRISRISARAGLKKSIAPSSTRHIALSAAKAEAGSYVAAALVGHKNTRSTVSTYLKSDPTNSLVSPAGKVTVSVLTQSAVTVSPREVPPSRQTTGAQPDWSETNTQARYRPKKEIDQPEHVDQSISLSELPQDDQHLTDNESDVPRPPISPSVGKF